MGGPETYKLTDEVDGWGGRTGVWRALQLLSAHGSPARPRLAMDWLFSEVN
ncbi:hypothetical protein T261_1380 [Streptomyces lydicus]|nr:hypothetical protein T261_1380 [Streptomyces lydicus]